MFAIQETVAQTGAVAAKAGNAASETITYSVGDSPAGKVLVARTSVGICAILIADDEDTLVSDLESRFPDRRRTRAVDDAADDLDAVAQYLRTPDQDFRPRLDTRHGTPFQRRVWSALGDVPFGSTVSYAELARRIGDPKSVRAVAGACAANSIALAIPCHRAVRSDGSLSGYRWGVDLKRSLIEKEARA